MASFGSNCITMAAKFASVQQFLDQRTLALAGVSRKDQKFGNTLYKELVKKNYTVYPVNPAMETFLGNTCYPTVRSVPADVKGLVIVTNSSQTLSLIKEGETMGIRSFWVQQGAESDEAMAYAATSDSTVIFKECLLMYARPVKGIHRAHRFFKKLFGKYPR